MSEIVIRPFREEDAAGCAELLNASDSVWPGTFTGGIAYTAERVLEDRREGDYLLDLVAEADGKLVGTCILTRDWDDPQAAYVAFLDVHPTWHGKGVGKGLLLRAVDEAVRLGVPYVSLHTWSGNERALPLYKKAGFFWLPGTDVRMENYLPLILRLPWAEEVLGGAHWYGCLCREIALEEDREEWRGREAFRYRLERGGKVLEVVIDRAAKAPCAVYAEGFSAELWPDPTEPRAVLPFKLCWRLVNRGQSPLTVALAPKGDPGVEASGGELVALGPGEERTGEFPGRVSPELEAELHRPSPAARLALLLAEGRVELACGLVPVLPVEVSTWPTPLVLAPGERKTVRLCLTNPHAGALSGRLSLAPGEGLEVSPAELGFQLPAGGTQAVELELSARAGGHGLGGRVELSSGEGWEMPPLPVLARGPGQVAGCLLGDREAYIAGEGFWLLARSRGGRLVFFRPGESHPLLRQGEELGPPFHPADLGQRRWGLELEEAEGGVRLTLRAESGRFPGLVLTKTALVTPGPLVELSFRLSAWAKGPVRLRLRAAHWDLPDLPWWIAFRAEQGLVRDHLGGFPNGETDFPRRLPEAWLALEAEGWVTGLLPQGEVEWDCGWSWSWKTPFRELAPGESAVFHRYFLYLGPGDFSTVRAIWAERTGTSPVHEEPRPLVWAEAPGPFLIGERGVLPLWVKTARGQPFSGKLSLLPPAGFSISPRELVVPQLTPDEPGRFDISWAWEGGRAGMGELLLSGMGDERRFPLPLIHLPQRPPGVAPGEREGGEVFSITAGESEFQVAPGFAAAVISWKVAGKEWLLSAFPQPRAFSWLSPWFGGIHPILYELALEEANWPGRLYREDFSGEPWTGKIGGMALSGVRLTSRLKGKGLGGLSVEVLYASPGEDVLLSALKVVNHGRPRRFAGGFLGFLSPDGEHRETALKTPGRTRIPSPYHAWYEARGWALVQAPSGAGILAVAPSRVEVGTWDAGEDGRHLGLNRSFSLAPGEGVSIWGWWVALAPGEEPTPWVALQRIPGPEGPDN